MTPQQKLKWAILARACDLAKEVPGNVTADTIDELYDNLVDAGNHWDAKNEIRQGEVETGLDCEWSRHYESKAVAAQMPDGSWVGWTYWYGGGKHAEPEAIEWMDDAYDLKLVEEEQVVMVRTFARCELIEA